MSTYYGAPGGPRDPATPGGYCLKLCWCGGCPQHAAQARRIAALRQAEYEARVRLDAKRAADRAAAAARRAA